MENLNELLYITVSLLIIGYLILRIIYSLILSSKIQKLKKDHKDQLSIERIKSEILINTKKEQSETIKEWAELLKTVRLDKQFAIEKIDQIKSTNRALKWANTKHKITIEKLKSTIDDYERNNNTSIQQLKEQADTIKRMNSAFDEVHILLETLLLNKKKDQEKLINNFIFKK